jgi:phosphoribosylaminoimidazole-succinocarboxamide synthase
VIENHLITDEVSKFPTPFCDYPKQLAGRSMLVKKTRVLPVECIVRGYITGSAGKSIKNSAQSAAFICLRALSSAKSCLSRSLPPQPRPSRRP